MQKKIIAITGPTASGKTKLAIDLAKKYNTEILSFDSRQCFKELDIGVAKPTSAELEEVKHHFINSHSVHEEVNAAVFETFALDILEKLFFKHDIVIAVGGTGLYLSALEKGMNEIPSIPIDLRNELQTKFEENGIHWLKEEIIKHDTNFATANDLHNSQRMLRALEVVLHTGKSIKYYQSLPNKKRDFSVEKMNITMDRQVLYERINKRVDVMIEQGLLKEVEQLLPFKKLNALQTVGYSELFDYLEGKMDLTTAVELVKQHTRNYAKRQMTWFHKNT